MKLECVAHDGARIRAQAGSDTFRREATLEKAIAGARQMVDELDWTSGNGEGGDARREVARRRVARERRERMEQAAEELKRFAPTRALSKSGSRPG